jgi:hypothetical protein
MDKSTLAKEISSEFDELAEETDTLISQLKTINK